MKLYLFIHFFCSKLKRHKFMTLWAHRKLQTSCNSLCCCIATVNRILMLSQTVGELNLFIILQEPPLLFYSSVNWRGENVRMKDWKCILTIFRMYLPVLLKIEIYFGSSLIHGTQPRGSTNGEFVFDSQNLTTYTTAEEDLHTRNKSNFSVSYFTWPFIFHSFFILRSALFLHHFII